MSKIINKILLLNLLQTEDTIPVSYTHLDVYKRQHLHMVYTLHTLYGRGYRTHYFIVLLVYKMSK